MTTKRQVSFRVTDEEFKVLEEMTTLMQTTQKDLILGLLMGEYDRIKGNPQMLEIMKQLGQLQAQLKQFGAAKDETVRVVTDGERPPVPPSY